MRQTGGEYVLQTTPFAQIDIASLIGIFLQETFPTRWYESTGLSQILLQNIEQMAVQQCKKHLQEESLPQYLLDERMFSARLNFREDADYLWNGKTQISQPLAAIDIVGYGVNPQYDSSQGIEQHVQELCHRLEISPRLARTHISTEMVYIRTIHGLTSSSLRTIERMQQAYSMIDVIWQSPYIHLNYENQQTRFVGNSRELTLTPTQIIEAWQHLTERLVESKSALAEKIRESIHRYSVTAGSQLRSIVDVSHPEHPYFNLIEELREALLPEDKRDLDLQILTAFADLEALLQNQEWLRIDPSYYDRFNPALHCVYQDAGRTPGKLSRIVEVVQPGYIRYRVTETQVRPAQVIVSTQLPELYQPDTDARIPSKE